MKDKKLVLRKTGWHCCQYDIEPENHPNCTRRLYQGCKGCAYAIWEISTNTAMKDDSLKEEETIQ